MKDTPQKKAQNPGARKRRRDPKTREPPKQSKGGPRGKKKGYTCTHTTNRQTNDLTHRQPNPQKLFYFFIEKVLSLFSWLFLIVPY
jgi:hypothetical protein